MVRVRVRVRARVRIRATQGSFRPRVVRVSNAVGFR
jgi:hypothetical protein